MDSGEANRLFDVLGDDAGRTILARIHDSPASARELKDACDASLRTIYRRLEALQDAGLVSTVVRSDEQGNHYTAYVTTVDKVEITVEPRDSKVDVEIHGGDDVDRFIGVWKGLQE